MDDPGDWMSNAYCKINHVDPYAFFNTNAKGGLLPDAESACGQCEVMTQCFRFGQRNACDGVWGGRWMIGGEVSPMVTKRCEICNALFESVPDNQGRARRRFCSKRCRNRHVTSQKSHTRAIRTKRHCLVCSLTIGASESEYCSSFCERRAAQMVGGVSA